MKYCKMMLQRFYLSKIFEYFVDNWKAGIIYIFFLLSVINRQIINVTNILRWTGIGLYSEWKKVRVFSASWSSDNIVLYWIKSSRNRFPGLPLRFFYSVQLFHGIYDWMFLCFSVLWPVLSSEEDLQLCPCSYIWSRLTNQNSIHDKIKCRLKVRN